MTIRINEKRYITFNEKDLYFTSKMIINSFYNDELTLIVIHGKQGFGKSSFASIVLAQVYGYIKGKEQNPDATEFRYDWNTAKKYFMFQPRDFLLKSREQKTKAPCCCVDDAGLWLNTMDFHDPLVKAVGKFLEVARTKWGAILFTCSDLKQIFTKVRNMPHVYTVRITKIMKGKKQKNRRTAVIYEGWVSEDMKKSGRKIRFFDIYYAEMPKVFYDWYQPRRAELADDGLNDIEIELNRLGI